MASCLPVSPLRPHHPASNQTKLARFPSVLRTRGSTKDVSSKNAQHVSAIHECLSSKSRSAFNKDLQTITARIIHTTRGHQRSPSGSAPGPPVAHIAPVTKESRRGQSQDPGLKGEKFAGGDLGDTRLASPQGILEAMIDLESPQESDDSEISPLSADLPLVHSASRLARFFPELSSHFAVVSPVSAHCNMDRSMDSSLFERELEERVQILYRGSLDAAPETGGSAGPTENFCSFAESGEILDCASSCYSRRTSVTTVDSEFWGDDGRHPYKTADAYSIHSPVAAGVFDDASSIISLYSPSAESLRRLRMPNVPARLRPGPITKTASMNDIRNKPLPLEPLLDSNSVPDLHSHFLLPIASPRSQSQRSTPCSQKDSLVLPQQSKMSHEDWKHSMLHQMNRHESKPACDTCGHSQPQPRPCHSRHQTDNPLRRHARHVPTLSQAAEELENTLANMPDQDWSQKTLLILDGPLQISRNNGDLIATRPAPLPPSTKPHSQTPVPSRLTRELRSIRSVGKSPTKGKSHKHSRKELKDKARPLSRNRNRGDEKLLEAKDILSRSSKTQTNPKKEKLSKKSFLTFGHKQSQVLRDAASVRSRSEDSLHMTLKFSHSADPLDLPPTRDDLRLQLPRLQTDDLAGSLENVVEPLLSDSPGPKDGMDGIDGAAPAYGETEAQAQPPHEKRKLRQSWALVSTAQASSVYVPDQIYELPATPPSPSSALPCQNGPKHDHVVNISLPADMPVDLIFTIMEKIDSLDDLFNFVLVNKKIYTAFKQRELAMLKNALFKMSPPAWELREMSPPWELEWQLLIDPDSQVPQYTPTLYLQRYAQDIYTLAKLKALVLARCAPFLRRDTIRGLAGLDSKRAEEVDDAFWRLWTFCRIFGSGKARENDIVGQMDWVKGGIAAKNHFTSSSTMTQPFGINNVLFEPPEGFGRGNLSGLSQKQMYDLTEIWTCMGVLLQPLHGKCIEARKVGIYDNMNVAEGDLAREETVLEEWTSYILTLGLGAVLTLSSVCPADTTAATFTKAKSIGLTKWELTETEASRSSFLKEVVSRVYELQDRTLESVTEISPEKTRFKSSPTTEISRQDRERQTAFARELRHRRAQGVNPEPEGRYSFSAERPMSEYSAIVHGLNGSIQDHPPVPSVPPLVLDRSSTSTSGTAPQTPTILSDPATAYASSQTPPPPPVIVPPPLRPQVLDPVDRAIDMIVNELGFNAEDAKWALKITDTGEGIDSHAAVLLLQRQRKKNQRNPFGQHDTLLSSVIKRQASQDSGWRWA